MSEPKRQMPQGPARSYWQIEPQTAGEAVERKSVTISGAIDEYLSHPEHRTAEMPSRQPPVRMAQAERLVEYEAGRRAGIEEPDPKLVEEVARLLAEQDDGWNFDELHAGAQEQFRERARAVLALPRVAAALELAIAVANCSGKTKLEDVPAAWQNVKDKLAAYRATLNG
jgi:hypothetical protein